MIPYRFNLMKNRKKQRSYCIFYRLRQFAEFPSNDRDIYEFFYQSSLI